jgi:membrane protein DedA with SNARE-associated domain
MRFLILSLLTLYFGPQIVGIAAEVFRRHFIWVVVAALLGVLVWMVLRRNRRLKRSQT